MLNTTSNLLKSKMSVSNQKIVCARAAREDGQWTAFKAFASDDAVLHGRNGPVAAKPVFDALDDPETAVQWSPRGQSATRPWILS